MEEAGGLGYSAEDRWVRTMVATACVGDVGPLLDVRFEVGSFVAGALDDALGDEVGLRAEGMARAVNIRLRQD